MPVAVAKPISLGLSDLQLKNLSKGKTIRLTHAQLVTSRHVLHLKPRNLGKIATAIRRMKGLQISLAPGESIYGGMQGAGLKDDLKTLHKKLKPQIRSFLHRQVNNLAPKAQNLVQDRLGPLVGANAARRMASAVVPAAHHAVNSVGDKTGGFGLSKRGRGRPRGATAARMAELRAMRGTHRGGCELEEGWAYDEGGPSGLREQSSRHPQASGSSGSKGSKSGGIDGSRCTWGSDPGGHGYRCCW